MQNKVWRAIKGQIAEFLCWASAGIAIIVLILILYYIFRRGISAISFEFLTALPTPVGVPGAGIGNALLGTITMVAIGTVLSVPLAIATAVYLDQNPTSLLAVITGFAARVLSGVPSLIIGLFVFTLLVLRTGQYSALAGGIALAVMMLPVITLSAEEMLRVVPGSWREASLALGASKKQTVMMLVLPAASTGIAVGVMLAVALAAGQTAPVLLTALTSNFWPDNLIQPTASLPVLIYTYAISPFEDWQQQAWGAALVLLIVILILNVTAQAFVALKNRR